MKKKSRKISLLQKIVASFVLLAFIPQSLIGPAQVSAQTLFNLPLPGNLIPLSSGFVPPLMKGIRIYPDNPLQFDFIIDTGHSDLESSQIKTEAQKLIRYFLTSLTVKEDDLWVNLSPGEKDRIIPNAFGETTMGRDLLAQDYLLKQLTASLLYPEDELGQKFWDKVHAKAFEMYGTTDVPMDTLNKVWIVPEKAVVYENNDTALVVESRLKVMLEEEYVAMRNNNVGAYGHTPLQDDQKSSKITTNIIRDVILPELEREVNVGKNFASLRQIVNSLILATWFKKNLKKSILNKIYVDQNKIEGVETPDKDIKEKIYELYLKAFQQGIYNFIKEDYDPQTQEIIPRKYFSGGASVAVRKLDVKTNDNMTHDDYAMLGSEGHVFTASAYLNPHFKDDPLLSQVEAQPPKISGDEAMDSSGSGKSQPSERERLKEKTLQWYLQDKKSDTLRAESRKKSHAMIHSTYFPENVTVNRGVAGRLPFKLDVHYEDWLDKNYQPRYEQDSYERNLGRDSLTLEIAEKRKALIEKGLLPEDDPLQILDIGPGQGYGLLSLAVFIAHYENPQLAQALIDHRDEITKDHPAIQDIVQHLKNRYQFVGVDADIKPFEEDSRGRPRADHVAIALFEALQEHDVIKMESYEAEDFPQEWTGRFHYIVSVQTFRYLFDELRAWEEIHRVLAVGGEAHVQQLKSHFVAFQYGSMDLSLDKVVQAMRDKGFDVTNRLTEGGSFITDLYKHSNDEPQLIFDATIIDDRGYYHERKPDPKPEWWDSVVVTLPHTQDRLEQEAQDLSEDEAMIKSTVRNAVYVDPVLRKGKLVDGELMEEFGRMTPPTLLKELDEFVAINCELNSGGGFWFAGSMWWGSLLGYESAKGITAHFKDGTLLAAYDKKGKKIYAKRADPKEGDRNSVYISPTIKSGKLIKGKFIGAFPYPQPLGAPGKILKDHKELAVTNAHFDSNGDLNIFNKTWVRQFKGYENATGVTLHFKDKKLFSAYDKKGHLIYQKSQEGDRNSFYLNPKLKKGKLIQGEFVGAYSSRLPTDLFKKHKEFVVTNMHLNSSGALTCFSRVWWQRLKGYENATGITAHFKDGDLSAVYDAKGECIYDGEKRKRNFIYLNPKIKNGKLVKGDFLIAYPGGVPEKLTQKFQEYVITDVVLNSAGGLFLGQKVYWHTKNTHRNAKGVLLHFKNGELIAAYDKKGIQIYNNKDEKKNNACYVNAKITNGKRVGGRFVGAFPHKSTQELLEEHNDFVVTNIKLGHRGEFRFAGRSWWGGMLSHKDETIIAHFKEGDLVSAYDRQGKQIYKQLKEGDRNSLYINPEIKNGKLIKGKFVGVYPRRFDIGYVKDYDEFVVKNVHLNLNGGLIFLGTTFWKSLPTHQNAKDITLHYKKRNLIAAYDGDGAQIYPHAEGARNALYLNPRVKDGKLVKGDFAGAYPRATKGEWLTQYSEFVLNNVRVGEHHIVGIVGKVNYRLQMPKGKSDDRCLFHFKDGELIAAYDSQGQKIYSKTQKGDPFSIYDGATVKNGKRVKGRFVGIFKDPFRKKFLEEYPSGIIENVSTNNQSIIPFGSKRKEVYLGKKYAGQKGFTVVYEDKEIKEVYDKKGNPVYTKPKEGDRNSLYVDAQIYKGKRVGGKFVGAYPVVFNKKLVKDYPNGIIENVTVNLTGAITLASAQLLVKLARQYAGKEGFTVVYEDAKIKEVYDQGGTLIYSSEFSVRRRKGFSDDNGIDEETRKEFQHLVEAGDIQRLLFTLGPDGALRVLSRIHAFTPISLKSAIRKYIDNLPAEDKQALAEPKQKFSFLSMRKVGFLKTRPRTYEDILTEEIIRSIYRDVAANHRFLDEIKRESQSKKNSALLRRIYKRVFDHYTAVSQLEFKGLNKEAIELKFYQKEGIQFLIDKKKAILADDPGTGKTIQAIMAALNIREGKGARKVLIISPRSAKDKIWRQEIETKTIGGHKIATVNAQTMKRKKGLNKMKEARFVIVNYEALRGRKGKMNPLRNQLMKMNFDCVIVDEAHRMRNETLQTEAIRGFDAEYKFLVTGSPIVGRKVGKIFNLLNWLYPGTFRSREAFEKKYGKDAESIKQLGEDLRSILLRRLERDVLDLPELHRVTIPVTLNPRQREIYRRIEKDFANWISQYTFTDRPSKAAFLTRFMKLRQAAIAAHMVENNIIFNDGQEEIIVPADGEKVKLNNKVYRIQIDHRTHVPVALLDSQGKRFFIKKTRKKRTVTINRKTYDVTVIAADISSSKYTRLDELFQDVIDKNEKIVFFSNFRKVVFDLYDRYLPYGINFLLGGLTEAQFNNEIEEFMTDDDQRVFVSTLSTGGQSISLTAANHVVLVDSPLTPQERDQAIKRLHRMLQKKQVHAYTLVAKDTVDEDIQAILAEGDLIFKLAFDDDPAFKELTDELIDFTLTKFKYSQKIIDQFKAYRHVKQLKVKKKDIPHLDELIDEDTDMKVRFKNKKFFALLENKRGELLEFRKFKTFLPEVTQLSTPSKNLLKKFFHQQLAFELENKVPVKNTLLWALCESQVPTMAHIDYHGQIEPAIEIATYIIEMLFHNQSLTIKDLEKNIDDSYFLSKALDFLDRHNILKALSLMGVLNRQYYFNGELLEYSPPIKIMVRDGYIIYRDDEIVEAIAPAREIYFAFPSAASYSYENMANSFRDLQRDEEIRLAREAQKGNEAAREALYYANIKHVIPLARTLYKNMKKTWLEGPLNYFNKEDFEDLFQEGAKAILEIIPHYYVEADQKMLKKFAKPFINKAVLRTIYQKAKSINQERKVLDKPLSADSEKTYRDSSLVAVEDETPEEKQAREAESELIRKANQILKEEGLRDEEIDIFFQYVRTGNYKGIFDDHGYNAIQIKDIIKTAQTRLKQSRLFSRLVPVLSASEEFVDEAMADMAYSEERVADSEKQIAYGQERRADSETSLRSNRLLLTAGDDESMSKDEEEMVGKFIKHPGKVLRQPELAQEKYFKLILEKLKRASSYHTTIADTIANFIETNNDLLNYVKAKHLGSVLRLIQTGSESTWMKHPSIIKIARVFASGANEHTKTIFTSNNLSLLISSLQYNENYRKNLIDILTLFVEVNPKAFTPTIFDDFLKFDSKSLSGDEDDYNITILPFFFEANHKLFTKTRFSDLLALLKKDHTYNNDKIRKLIFFCIPYFLKANKSLATSKALGDVLDFIKDYREQILPVLQAFVEADPKAFNEDNWQYVRLLALEGPQPNKQYTDGYDVLFLEAFYAIPFFLEADPKAFATDDNLRMVTDLIKNYNKDWAHGTALDVIPAFLKANPKFINPELLQIVLGRIHINNRYMLEAIYNCAIHFKTDDEKRNKRVFNEKNLETIMYWFGKKDFQEIARKALILFLQANPGAFTDKNLKLAEHSYVYAAFYKANKDAFTEENLKEILEELKQEYCDSHDFIKEVVPYFFKANKAAFSKDNFDILLDVLEGSAHKDITTVFRLMPKFFEVNSRLATENALNKVLQVIDKNLLYDAPQKILVELIPTFVKANKRSFSQRNFDIVFERIQKYKYEFVVDIFPFFIEAQPRFASEDNLKNINEKLDSYESWVRAKFLPVIPSFLKSNPSLKTRDHLKEVLIATDVNYDQSGFSYSDEKAIEAGAEAVKHFVTDDPELNKNIFDEENLKHVLELMKDKREEGRPQSPKYLAALELIPLFAQHNKKAFSEKNLEKIINDGNEDAFQDFVDNNPQAFTEESLKALVKAVKAWASHGPYWSDFAVNVISYFVKVNKAAFTETNFELLLEKLDPKDAYFNPQVLSLIGTFVETNSSLIKAKHLEKVLAFAENHPKEVIAIMPKFAKEGKSRAFSQKNFNFVFEMAKQEMKSRSNNTFLVAYDLLPFFFQMNPSYASKDNFDIIVKKMEEWGEDLFKKILNLLPAFFKINSDLITEDMLEAVFTEFHDGPEETLEFVRHLFKEYEDQSKKAFSAKSLRSFIKHFYKYGMKDRSPGYEIIKEWGKVNPKAFSKTALKDVFADYGLYELIPYFFEANHEAFSPANFNILPIDPSHANEEFYLKVLNYFQTANSAVFSKEKFDKICKFIDAAKNSSHLKKRAAQTLPFFFKSDHSLATKDILKKLIKLAKVHDVESLDPIFQSFVDANKKAFTSKLFKEVLDWIVVAGSVTELKKEEETYHIKGFKLLQYFLEADSSFAIPSNMIIFEENMRFTQHMDSSVRDKLRKTNKYKNFTLLNLKAMKWFLKANEDLITEDFLYALLEQFVLEFRILPDDDERSDIARDLVYLCKTTSKQRNKKVFSANNLEIILNMFMRTSKDHAEANGLSIIRIFAEANPNAFTKTNLKNVLNNIEQKEIIEIFQQANPKVFDDKTLKVSWESNQKYPGTLEQFIATAQIFSETNKESFSQDLFDEVSTHFSGFDDNWLRSETWEILTLFLESNDKLTKQSKNKLMTKIIKKGLDTGAHEEMKAFLSVLLKKDPSLFSPKNFEKVTKELPNQDLSVIWGRLILLFYFLKANPAYVQTPGFVEEITGLLPREDAEIRAFVIELFEPLIEADASLANKENLRKIWGHWAEKTICRKLFNVIPAFFKANPDLYQEMGFTDELQDLIVHTIQNIEGELDDQMIETLEFLKDFHPDLKIICQTFLAVEEEINVYPEDDQSDIRNQFYNEIYNYFAHFGSPRDMEHVVPEMEDIYAFLTIVHDNLPLILKAFMGMDKPAGDFHQLRKILPFNNALTRIIRMLGEQEGTVGGYKNLITRIINMNMYNHVNDLIMEMAKTKQRNAPQHISGVLDVLQESDLPEWSEEDWIQFKHQIHKYYAYGFKVITLRLFKFFVENEGNPQLLGEMREDIAKELGNIAWGGFMGLSEEFKKKYQMGTKEEIALLTKYLRFKDLEASDYAGKYEDIKQALQQRGEEWTDEVDPTLRELYRMRGSKGVIVYEPKDKEKVDREELHNRLVGYTIQEETQQPIETIIQKVLQSPKDQKLKTAFKKMAIDLTLKTGQLVASNFNTVPQNGEAKTQSWLIGWQILIRDTYKNDTKDTIIEATRKAISGLDEEQIRSLIESYRLPEFISIRDKDKFFREDDQMVSILANGLNEEEQIEELSKIFLIKWLVTINTNDIQDKGAFGDWVNRGLEKFVNRITQKIQKKDSSKQVDKKQLERIVREALMSARTKKAKELKEVNDVERKKIMLADRAASRLLGIFSDNLKDIQKELKGFKTVEKETSTYFYTGFFDDLLHLMGFALSGACTWTTREKRVQDTQYHFGKVALKDDMGRLLGVSQVQLLKSGIRGFERKASPKGWQVLALPGINVDKNDRTVDPEKAVLAMMETAQRLAKAHNMQGAVLPIEKEIRSNWAHINDIVIPKFISLGWLEKKRLQEKVFLADITNRSYYYDEV